MKENPAYKHTFLLIPGGNHVVKVQTRINEKSEYKNISHQELVIISKSDCIGLIIRFLLASRFSKREGRLKFNSANMSG